MRATISRPQSSTRVGKSAAGTPSPVEHGRVPFASSLLWSLGLHSCFLLVMLVGGWVAGRPQPYRLAPQTVYLAGDSPIGLDGIPGEGGGASGAKQEGKEPGSGSKSAQGGAGAEPSVEKFVPPVEKPTPPPPKPVTEKPVVAPMPKPVVKKAVVPPPKPSVEKPALPVPPPKPVVEKAIPAPPKPPPEAMTLAQKPVKPQPPATPSSTVTEAQQKMAKLREQQTQQETATDARQKVAKLREQQAQQDAAEQKVASLRTEQADRQAAQQRLNALRAKVGSGSGSGGSGTGEGNGGAGGTGTTGSGPGSGAAGSGVGGGAPGGGRGTGLAGAGGVGTGGLSGIRLRNYQAELQAKITNAWNIPAQSKGLQASVFLIVGRSGQVEQARLVQGSGNALFDESLQRAIKQAQPLPSLPEDYAERSLEVTLRFRGRG